MLNKAKGYLKNLKELCFSSHRGMIYFLAVVGFILVNLMLVPALWENSNSFFHADDVYAIIYLFITVGFYLSSFVLTPIGLRTGLMEGKFAPILLKMLSVWLPFGIITAAQTVIFCVCTVFSESFSYSVARLIFGGIVVGIVVFFWIKLFAIIYYFTKRIRWYVLGWTALNFAPCVFCNLCNEIFNVNPLISNSTINPLSFNLFWLSYWFEVGFKANEMGWWISFVGIIVFTAIFVFAVWLREKKKLRINREVLATCFKVITILGIALLVSSVISGSIYSRDVGSRGHGITFSCIFWTLTAVGTYRTFYKKKPLVKTAISLIMAVVVSFVLFEAIPAYAKREAYSLPKEEDIESIDLSLDLSLNNFTVDRHFGECLELHRMLLDIFDEGHFSDYSVGEYVKPECVGDEQTEVKFIYNLKNGEKIFRTYTHLKGEAFDKFFIEFYKSDLYIYSLKNTKTDRPRITYERSNGSDDSCMLPEECVTELIDAYCEELKMADSTFFYSEYDSIRLERFYENGRDRMIFVPHSFVKTRGLAQKYTETYEPW